MYWVVNRIHFVCKCVQKSYSTSWSINQQILLLHRYQLADLAPYGILPSPSKYEVIDTTVPFLIEPYRLVVPWPKPESRLLAPIRPFQPLVICSYIFVNAWWNKINNELYFWGLAFSWSDSSGDADCPSLSDFPLPKIHRQ